MALAALSVLSLWLLIVLAATIVRWEQVLWYSEPVSIPTRRRHETVLDAMLSQTSQCVADAKPNIMRDNPPLCGICKPSAVA